MLPEFTEAMARMGEIISMMKTYGLKVYPAKVKGDAIFVDVH